MTELLSPAKVILLATHFATKADLDSLTSLSLRYDKVLHKELLLRILLTCLPETLDPSEYVPFVQRIESDDFLDQEAKEINCASIEEFSESEAVEKVRKLHLLPLTTPTAPADAVDDPVSLFLIQRARYVDEAAGLLDQLPDLIVPFLDHAPCIRTWMVSALLPLLRRNYEYYPDEPIPQTLANFEQLNDREAVSLLLDHTGVHEDELSTVGRDLRGLVGPWLCSESRWRTVGEKGQDPDAMSDDRPPLLRCVCPGWEQVLEWLTAQASRSWKVVVAAMEQWDGPGDVDFGNLAIMWFNDDQQSYLERRYAHAALASAYLIPEASVEALTAIGSIINKVRLLMGEDPCPTLQVASSMLSPVIQLNGSPIMTAKNATHMRNDLLEESNPLTKPSELSTQLLFALTLSAFILTKAGLPCTVRRAGELVFLQDVQEQKAEAVKLIAALRDRAPKTDENYWVRTRNELLWLRDWAAEEAPASSPDLKIQGVFGDVPKEFLEVECLKGFLSSGRYVLARSIYEESSNMPLPRKVLEDTVIAAAMNAYDNASNPNRARGGLLKCDDIIHAFPKTIPESSPPAKRIEALLKATHGLSEYRLVLKQGEPFTPVVLRVHSDPISIIGKLLEQNPKSYTRLQDFLEIGSNMVDAGLPVLGKSVKSPPPDQTSQMRSIVEKRVIAMCVDAALTEDDFETAYSYAVNRLASTAGSAQYTSVGQQPSTLADDYSWKAALQAGKYRRTQHTIRPTHVGTASANLDVRHLEQRIECLSIALRIAPPATLQEILNVFRRCEEELDAALKAEQQEEAAWDDEGDVQAMPGAFSSTVPAGVHRSSTFGVPSKKRQEEAPMSLFDLSRASMTRAQQNISALSSLRSSTFGAGAGSGGQQIAGASDEARARAESQSSTAGEDRPRVRKRDQLANAAVGTLASGVGWLIGAQPVDRGKERE